MKSLKRTEKQIFSASDQTGEAAGSAVHLHAAAQDARSSAPCFDHLVPADLVDVVHVVPAEQVGLHVAALPLKSQRQRRAALPFALEDRIAQGLEDTHCAICGRGEHGALLAATVARTEIAALSAAHPGRMLIPEQALLPPPEPAPDGGAAWRCVRVGTRVLVRCSDKTGFAARTDMLPLLWERAGRPTVINLAQPLPVEITRVTTGQMPIPEIADLRGADLRQGAFRPPRGLARPMRWLAASVVLAAAGHLLILAFDTAAQRRIADTLRTEAEDALASHLPTVSADHAPALVLRRIAARAAPQAGSGFLPLMERVARAMQAGAAPVQFRELAWTEDALRLTVEAPDLEALQAAQAALGSAGLTVSAGSATAGDGAARAELTVRP